MRRLFALLGALALGAMLAAPAGAAKTTTLRITLQLPLKSHLGQNLLLFKDEVERQSKGDIKVEIYDSAQLYKDKEVPQAVSSGAIEMGVASLTRFVGTIPAVDIFYVPFMFSNEEMVRKATAPGSPVRGPIDDAILKTGARPLWWQAYGSAIILGKVDKSIRTPADIKNKKVRVFGKTLGKFIEALDGAPTLISGSEQYLAYQRGTVDVGMTGVSGVKSRKLYQVMDSITVTNHADIEFLVLVNEKFWQSLSDAQRTLISAAGRKAEIAVRDAVAKIEADAYAEAKSNGMTIVKLSPAEVDTWRKATKPVLDDYLASSGELGARLVKAAEALR